jgi:exopolysaccharide production protein ExoZ
LRQFISIQYLRGLAAMLVLVTHVAEGAIGDTAHVSHPFAVGASGVDIFFVISGFIMWSSTAQRPNDVLAFWTARAVRIVPLYWIYTFLSLIWYVYNHEIPATFRYSEIVRSLLFVPFTNSINGTSVPILGVGWTLNYEALFYLVFGLGLLVGRPAWRFAGICGVLVLLCLCRPFVNTDNAFAFRFTSPLFLEFGAGMAIAILLSSRRFRIPPWAGAALALAGAVCLVFAADRVPPAPRTIVFGIPAALVVLGVVVLDPVLDSRRFPPLKLLGDASYSIYLSHGLVLSILVPALAGSAPMPAGGIATVIAVTTGGGVLSYWLLERPLLGWMRPLLLARRRPTAAIGGGT